MEEGGQANTAPLPRTQARTQLSVATQSLFISGKVP